VAAARPTPTPSPAPLYVDVPTGVRIQVKMDEYVSSQDAPSGRLFHFETIRDASAGSRKVPKGTHGYGIVEYAVSRNQHNAGRLDVSARLLDLGNGEAIPVALPRDADDTLPIFGSVVRLEGKDSTENAELSKGEIFVVVTTSAGTPQPLPHSEST